MAWVKKEYCDLLEDFRGIVGSCNPHNVNNKAFGVCVGLARLARGEGVDYVQYERDLEGVVGRSRQEWNSRIACRWSWNSWKIAKELENVGR